MRFRRKASSGSTIRTSTAGSSKIGQCQADGSFKIVQAAEQHVPPDPYSIYPDIGKCTAAGLKAPDGKMRKSVI